MLSRKVISKFLSTSIYRSVRFNSSNSKPLDPHSWQISTLADGTIACWHPEKPFPFEHSRPIDSELLARDREDLNKLRERRKTAAELLEPSGPKNCCKDGVQNTNTRRTTLRNFCPITETTEMIRGIWFGRRSFAEGLRIQEELYQLVRSQKTSNKHFLCLIEHSPVYTVGLRDHFYDKEKEQQLRNLGADFQRIKRGGLITFHGPGQLVAYPILNLRDLRVDDRIVGVKKYVCLIEEVVIRLASENFKILNVSRTEDPGVWVERDRKLAAIGVQVRYGITTHGLALNCDTDMKWFDKIVPCGLEGKTVTSLSVETSHKVTINDTIEPFVQTFEKVFESKISYINAQSTSIESRDSISALGQ
ncbi:Lipoate-protein ligase B [Aphelenchoides besseyi]|nr:Lipoate-protein ligase B [Aphelenchoides besseyi]KAI6194739.1 Lipoate-protein ligase B [Aphelenchoides besseyi]